MKDKDDFVRLIFVCSTNDFAIRERIPLVEPGTQISFNVRSTRADELADSLLKEPLDGIHRPGHDTSRSMCHWVLIVIV